MVSGCIHQHKSSVFTVCSLIIVSSNEQSVVLGNSSCIEVPPVSVHQSLYVVWPGDPDCICPMCNDGNCVLGNCQCYSSSSFAPEINIGISGNAMLCWSNLENNRNNSKIHFFVEIIPCSSNTGSHPLFNKRFVGSSKFVVRGKMLQIKDATKISRSKCVISLTGPPSPPNLTVSIMPGDFTICFSAYSYYQIKQYSINITDFTGDLLFTRDLLEPTIESCINCDMRDYPVECTPFNITIMAFNDVGASNTTNKELVLGNSIALSPAQVKTCFQSTHLQALLKGIIVCAYKRKVFYLKDLFL